jgi:hypothetical protein
MPTSTTTDRSPWFRNRMVWLVMAIPALTVAGCMLTIFLAISNPDEIISDYSLRTDLPAGEE